MQIQNQFEQRSFLRFLDEDPEAFRRGLYYEQFRRYLDHFERDKLLVLVFEVAMRQPRTELSRVADFLSIDPGGFSECPQGRRIGASHRPRFPYARSVAVRARKALRDKDMDWVINLSAKLGIPRLFGDHGAPPPMASADRGVLRQRYEPSIRALEALLALDLTVWRQ